MQVWIAFALLILTGNTCINYRWLHRLSPEPNWESSFKLVFSVVGASAFLPFLPMLPIQVLTNNLLYDFSQQYHHPHRPGGPRVVDQAAPVGDWQDPALYSMHRADQLDLRLRHVLPHALRFQLLAQSGPLPHRLVCGIALHTDVDHPCHPHQQDPVHPKLGQLAAEFHLLNHRRGRGLADGFAAG